MERKINLKRKYNILFIGPRLEIIGGVSEYCKSLINNLSSDFRVHYFMVGSRSTNDSFFVRLISLVQDTIALLSRISRNSYDIIHINPSLKPYSLLRDSLYLCVIRAFHLSAKTIVFFHGWDGNLAERISRKALWRKIFRAIYKNVGLIFVLFQGPREQLTALGIDPKKIKITTTMFERHENSSPDVELPEKNRDDTIHILFMSRFLIEKGVFIAAEVARLLAQGGCQKFRFVFAGEGPEFESLKDFIAKHKLENYIETPGFVSGENKKNVLEKSDIFLFPTFYGEGCPIVVLEAMGAGLAIVSNPAGAIADIVKHNENGFIVNSKDPEDFYQAINKLILKRDLLQSFQRANRKKAEDNFEASIVTKKMEFLYLSIINASHSQALAR